MLRATINLVHPLIKTYNVTLSCLFADGKTVENWINRTVSRHTQIIDR